MSELESFRSLMRAPVPDLEVTVTAITSFGRPQVTPQTIGSALDGLAETVLQVGGAADADALVRALTTAGRLRGDRVTYQHPDNSLLDRVLERRLGIPLSLTVAAVLVGRRVGVALEVVPMPGHVLATSAPGVFHDLFAEGERLDAAGARRRFESLFGSGLPWSDDHLLPAGTEVIAARWLGNLAGASAAVGDRRALLRALRLESCLAPLDPPRRRLVASLLEEFGAFDEAAGELDALAASGPDDAEDLHRRADALRARLN